jgi:glutaryl-CoA dehydrogenase
MSAAPHTRPRLDPHDPASIDTLLTADELAVRQTVREFCADKVAPHVAGWYERGELPGARALTRELGKIGLLGMHLTGYGCAGMSAVDYGLACLELEATDSGLRSLVSVQGSLAMFAIWKFGSEAHRTEWLPRMAAGEAIGCFGLTEPDAGSDPASMRTAARRDGPDWVLQGRKMWITNGTIADVAVVWAQTDDGIRGFVVPADTPGFSAPEIKHKGSLRASVTAELVLDAVRLPADAVLPAAAGLRGPLSCLNEARFGIFWGALGAARSCYETALQYARSRVQFGSPIGAFQLTQEKLANMAVELVKGQLLALHFGRLKDLGQLAPEHVSIAKLNNTREALEICRTARTILGGNGISYEFPVMRHMANLESVLTYEGTPEMHTLVIGQALKSWREVGCGPDNEAAARTAGGGRRGGGARAAAERVRAVLLRGHRDRAGRDVRHQRRVHPRRHA